MSAFWGSDVRPAVLSLFTAVALLATAGSAEARREKVTQTTTDHGTVRVRELDGRVVERVVIDDHGVTVSTSNGDSLVAGDSLGHGALVIDEGNGIVRFLSDARVKPGDHVDGDVVAILGNVHVAGEVTGSAVAVFGRVEIEKGGSVGGDAVAVFGGLKHAGVASGSTVAVLGGVDLQPGASVGGDAVAVGGGVSDPEGTHVAGQSVSISMLPLTLGLPALPVVLTAIALGWLATVFFGWLFGVLFPDRLARVAVTSSRHTFLSIVISLLSLVLWPMAAILIMATIIGLPVGIVLWLAYPVVIYAGQLAATYVLGCKLVRRRLGEGRPLGPIAAGSALIAFFYAAAAIAFAAGGIGGAFALFLGLVGLLVLLGLTAIGTGALLLSRFGSRSRGDDAPMPVPAGAPGAATA